MTADGGGDSADGGPADTGTCATEGCALGVCDELTGVCVECLVDPDCPDAWDCNELTNTCHLECTNDSNCPAGEICNDTGLCVPGDVPGGECVDPTDCDPSLGCGAGYCLRCQGNGNFCNECEDDADCGAAFVCNTDLASCVFCISQAECNGGEMCHPYGDCAPACDDAADCPHGRLCDGFGRCIPPPAGSDCMIDTDCPAGSQCEVGLCKACILGVDGVSCQQCQPGSSDCGLDAVCDHDVFVCVSCHDDSDCAGGEVCEHGGCIPA